LSFIASIGFNGTSIIAGTPGSGLWKRPLLEMIVQQYSVSASVSSANAGSASGSGTFDEGTQITVTATPNSNYAFVN
jgi:hypothetical protein